MDAHVEPEEVGSADTLQFPAVETSDQGADSGVTGWLIYLSLLVGLIALAIAMLALRKAS